MVWWVCRFDTLGKLVSAHHAGVLTTPGWGVTPGRGVAALAGATFAGAATPRPGVKKSPLGWEWWRPPAGRVKITSEWWVNIFLKNKHHSNNHDRGRHGGGSLEAPRRT